MAFSLSNLQPDREPFDLGDKLIYFRNTQDFDLQELAAWQRLKKTMTNVVKMREKATTEDQHARASAKSLEASREYIALVLPDLPSTTLDSLNAGQIDHLASMCITVASGALRQNTASAELQAMVLARYPDLPEEFVQTLSHGQCQRLLPDEEPEPAKN